MLPLYGKAEYFKQSKFLMAEFNIASDSAHLKKLVSVFEPAVFLAEITELLKLDGYGRIPYRPFVSLDSPLRQLAYLGYLNLTSDPNDISKKEAPTNLEWENIIEYSVRVKAGYFDALLPTSDDNEDEYQELYNVAMSVFFDFHDTGTINYEEQEIARIEVLFTPFDDVVKSEFGLSVKDFIQIYDAIGELIQENFNEPLRLIKSDPELNEFKNKMKAEGKFPADWKYEGTNLNIKRFIRLMTDHLQRNTISLDFDALGIDKGKFQNFFKHFTIKRASTNFQYYTEPNYLLLNPIFELGPTQLLIISHKQLIHAIFKKIYLCIAGSKKAEKLFTHRGSYLQNKTISLFRKFLKNEGHYYNEYKIDGKGQDVLILYGGIAFIIETKAGKEVELSRMPDVKHLYKQYLKTFKTNIEEAYKQCFRVKENFLVGKVLSIHDKENNHVYDLRTRKFRNAFCIIVTQDRFRNPQVNLPHLLDIYDDDQYPLSICIDDLEILILTLIKERITPGNFERMLIQREKLQGRVATSDELEIWGHLIFDKSFKIADEEDVHFSPGIHFISKFDELYANGIGFENEGI